MRQRVFTLLTSAALLALVTQLKSSAAFESKLIGINSNSRKASPIVLPSSSVAIAVTIPRIGRNSALGVTLGLFGSSDDKTKNIKINSIAKVTTIESLDDFSKFVAEDEHLCIVKFRASWCKTCQKFDKKFHKFAIEMSESETGTQVRFADVEYGANKQLCRTMGIKKLPYIHMYKGSHGRIDDFVCTPKSFQTLVDKMEEHVDLDNNDDYDNDHEEETTDYNNLNGPNDMLHSILEAGSNMVGKYMKDMQTESS